MPEDQKPVDAQKHGAFFAVERAILGILITGLVIGGLYWKWLSPYETLATAITLYGWLVSRATLGRVADGVNQTGPHSEVKGIIGGLIGDKGPLADTLQSAMARTDPKHQESKAKRVGRFLLGAAKAYLTGRIS